MSDEPDTMGSDGKEWRWKIEPNPYDSDYDSCVTDSDLKALEIIKYAAEMTLWDGIEHGETLTLKVTFNENVKEQEP